MKKISTLKNVVPVSNLRTSGGIEPFENEKGGEFEPDEQSVNNILNYSKALTVRKSSFLKHIVNLNN
jgi:hypothetical protein